MRDQDAGRVAPRVGFGESDRIKGFGGADHAPDAATMPAGSGPDAPPGKQVRFGAERDRGAGPVAPRVGFGETGRTEGLGGADHAPDAATMPAGPGPDAPPGKQVRFVADTGQQS